MTIKNAVPFINGSMIRCFNLQRLTTIGERDLATTVVVAIVRSPLIRVWQGRLSKRRQVHRFGPTPFIQERPYPRYLS